MWSAVTPVGCACVQLWLCLAVAPFDCGFDQLWLTVSAVGHDSGWLWLPMTDHIDVYMPWLIGYYFVIVVVHGRDDIAFMWVVDHDTGRVQ